MSYDSEKSFFEKIMDKVEIIFDVGSYTESIYIEYAKIVHYFDPCDQFIQILKTFPNKNKESYFNSFGLSDTEDIIKYYPSSQSLVKRPNYSSDDIIYCQIKRADKYMDQLNIKTIDFLKIDVECLETFVFKGFGERMRDVKIIQFEYGPGNAEVGDNLDKMLTLLENYGFVGFHYLFHDSLNLIPIICRNDTWRWCNIVAYNKFYFNETPW